jgi:hypothetical protein
VALSVSGLLYKLPACEDLKSVALGVQLSTDLREQFLLFVSRCCCTASLYLLAVASGGQAEVIFERTHEARSVPIARRVCNLLN